MRLYVNKEQGETEWRHPGNTAEQNPTNEPREAKLKTMDTRRGTIKVKQGGKNRLTLKKRTKKT